MNTTKLNKTTKKAEKWIKEYKKSFCISVKTFYGKCSSAKVEAENTIKKRITEKNCHNYYVLNGNCSYFTCAYLSSENKTLFFETVSNIFEIEVDFAFAFEL